MRAIGRDIVDFIALSRQNDLCFLITYRDLLQRGDRTSSRCECDAMTEDDPHRPERASQRFNHGCGRRCESGRQHGRARECERPDGPRSLRTWHCVGTRCAGTERSHVRPAETIGRRGAVADDARSSSPATSPPRTTYFDIFSPPPTDSSRCFGSVSYGLHGRLQSGW